MRTTAFLAVVFSAASLLVGAASAQERAALDFSTAPDETGDVFELSVEDRYRAPMSRSAAIADLKAAGMTCNEGAQVECTKSVEANGCSYQFVATVGGTAEAAVVRGNTRHHC
jgi:hypothetical protein